MERLYDRNRTLLLLATILMIVLQRFAAAQDYDPMIVSDAVEQEVYQNTELRFGEEPVERFRKSFYQGTELVGGYLADLGDKAGGLDVSFEEARVSLGVPLGSMDNLLAIRPYFRADHLNGPTTIDVPETLYDTGVSLFNRRVWSDRFSTTVMITPSVRSDFTTSKKAFRLFGLGLVNWQKRPDLSLSLGVVYLGRSDLPLLPAFGATWTPNPWWKFDAMLPRPRIARRLWKQGGQAEAWAYIGGTLGGNTWAVTRDSGADDELTLSDLRLLAGYEQIRAGNRGLFVEGGYSFNRSIEYEQTEDDIDLDDALFVQAGWQF
ncbi:DUF6268 family outer membrane beta-barrel protein [Novipirellula artificiosorum]|uniref:Uncharacterized protein n=1 Tax=Novipirellula artificiosorum TaxID=2528016 RepID=A0A5C6DU01_9BACT|nr:DUF6268 family outer membrane beta-barrel protein [Novipirellula artificiosorum]TWU40843.1 hypothetical protein Poly41_16780 [Novipirellula artificiosorum]